MTKGCYPDLVDSDQTEEDLMAVTYWVVGNGSRHPTAASLLEAPGYLARRMYQSYVALWTKEVDAVMTGPQFAVLTATRAYPGVDQRTLASSVALDTSTMTDIVRRLVQRGLIRRETTEEDGRRRLLYLTQEGVTQLDEITHRARALDKKLMAGYSQDERERILNELTVLGGKWEALAAE